MASRYTLKTLTTFAAAHSLRDYPGLCRNLHGHNWKVEVEVTAWQLDALGMAIDFKTIKKAANAVADALDHHYLNELNPFDQQNPTAENIAAYFYRELGAILNTEHAKVSAVTVWETDTASARYSEE